ncbi:helix-turn-helix domain-containing protein [Flavobacteriaceae bacterium R38]|nr:helix-turn-helix domain-containing protein [Flavobacteriaceae bacterium R38]
MISKALDIYFPELAKIPALKSELITICRIEKFEAGTIILKQDSYVKVIPLVVSGLAKVYKEEPEQGNEMLLYYIQPGESCIMSMTNLIRNQLSQVKAVIEETAEVVLVPADKALAIANKYPKWNEFIYSLFNAKFDELLNTIEMLTFSNKEKRLLAYIRKEVAVKETNIIKTTHQHIADELGSSREVISRLLKKLEHEGYVQLNQKSIEYTG